MPLLNRAELWIDDNNLAFAANNSSSSSNSNSNETSPVKKDTTTWLYNYCFCLAVDAKNVEALEDLLVMAAESKHVANDPTDNNEALLRVAKYLKNKREEYF